MKKPDRRRAEIIGVTLLFILNGALSQALSPRFADIGSKLGLSTGELGLSLLGSTIGLAVIAGVFSLRLGERLGRRISVGVPLLLFCLSPALTAVAVSGPTLFATQLFRGGTNAPIDLARNTLVLGLSARLGKQLQSRFELGFSLGALVGAGAGAFTAGKLELVPYLLWVSGVAVAFGLLAWFILPTGKILGEEEEGERRSAVAPLSDRHMWTIAIFAFFALFAEFVAQDWASVFFRDELHAPPTEYGYGGFVLILGFVIVLPIGAWLTPRVGARVIVRISGAVFTLAMVALVSSHSVLGAVVAFGFAGIGAGNLVPLALSGLQGHPRYKLWAARVAAVMYLGRAASRGVGALAEVVTLRWALTVCAIPAGLLVIAMAAVLPREQNRSGPEEADSTGALPV